MDAKHQIEALYREQGQQMWRALLAFSGDPGVASEALAEAFAQALRRGTAIRDPRSWVWRSAFKIAAGELRQRRTTVPLQDEALGSYELDQPDHDLLDALRSLGERQRTAIVMHYAAGYPISEIATILGASSAAVKMDLMRARRRLRGLLGDEDA